MDDQGGGGALRAPPWTSLVEQDENDFNKSLDSQKVNTESNQLVLQDKVKVNKPTVFYDAKDFGPFFVYIESQSSKDNIGRFSHLKIARDIFNLQLKNVKTIKNKGLNRVCIEFISAQAANSFIENKNLKDKGYNIFIPLNFTTSKGLVREIDLDLSEAELLEACSCRNDIITIKRLNRKVFKNDTIEYVPTGTCLFTFKGTIMPKEIKFFGLSLPVAVYISPVTQCYSCLLYGHTKKNCKGQEKCFNCGEKNAQNHKTMDNGNDKPEYTCETKCHFCKEAHKSSYKKCPEYLRQMDIKKLMAYENMTFHDASSACKKTYQTRDDFFFNPSEFPQINPSHKPHNENVITPNQRRTAHFNNNSKKRTFSQTVINEPTRKRVIHQSGYDKKAHNDSLNFPNGRTQNANSSTSISNSMPSASRNSYNIDSEYSLSYHNISQSPSSAAKNNYDTTNLPKYTAPEEDTIQLIEKFLHLPSAKEALHGFILSYMNRETYRDLDDPDMF